jgi:hypothetical protein
MEATRKIRLRARAFRRAPCGTPAEASVPKFKLGVGFGGVPPDLQERINRDIAGCGGLPPDLQERISRDIALQRAWGCDPRNKAEAEFCFEAGFRPRKLADMRAVAANVAAPDAVALAVRNAMPGQSHFESQNSASKALR